MKLHNRELYNCILRQMFLGWSNQGGQNGLNMRDMRNGAKVQSKNSKGDKGDNIKINFYEEKSNLDLMNKCDVKDTRDVDETRRNDFNVCNHKSLICALTVKISNSCVRCGVGPCGKGQDSVAAAAFCGHSINHRVMFKAESCFLIDIISFSRSLLRVPGQFPIKYSKQVNK